MTPVMGFFSYILSNAFIFSLLLIVISSLVGIFVRQRSRDRCLRSFDEFRVTLEKSDGKLIWGILHVYGSGLELEYQKSHHDLDGHLENTYILYAEEFGALRALYRYHDELTEENQNRRLKEIRKSYKPNVFRLLRRKLRNFFNTFRDSITQTFNLIVGNLTSTQPKSVFSQKKKDISGIGNQMIGGISKAFDPILEKYIGHFVVIESFRDEKKEEVCGILKEYTDKFIEILNVPLHHPFTVSLNSPVKNIADQSIQIVRDGLCIQISNNGDSSVYLKRVSGDSFSRPEDVYIDKGNSIRIVLTPEENEEATIYCEFSQPRRVDVVVPRILYTIRHGGLLSKKELKSMLGINTVK
jgi:hypothetical protein